MQKTLIISISLAIAFVLVWSYAHSESYCFFDPAIDTRFSLGFSEINFDRVRVDMSAQGVEQLLGKPLNKSTNSEGIQRWDYSQDGRAFFGDWAWLGREVFFRDGKVTNVVLTTYYD